MGTFCSLVPINMASCHKQMEKTANQFTAQAQSEVLRNSSSRLMQVQCVTEEKKFKTKLAKVTLTLPREAWMEYKQYRVRVWKSSKLGLAKGGDDDGDKKKDEEKKDG